MFIFGNSPLSGTDPLPKYFFGTLRTGRKPFCESAESVAFSSKSTGQSGIFGGELFCFPSLLTLT